VNRYRLGLIGAGMYGKELIHRFQQDERAVVTWVTSASTATTQTAAQQFGIEKWTLDYRDILADPTVDAVVIATPPYLHAQQLTAALAAGKHVLVEKPLAESPQSVHQILEAVAQAPGQIYHVHHNHLSRSTFVEWNPNRAWAMNKQLAGGGAPAETPNETRLYGTRGSLRFRFPSWESGAIELSTIENGEPRMQTVTVPAGGEDDSAALARHFLDCLDGTAQPAMSVHLAAKHLDILFKIIA
jgi:predicted dehydrogenase